jgi:hypothetical protein
MSRRNQHPWREDRLGELVRAGLRDQSFELPSPAVWERIAEEVEPRSRRRFGAMSLRGATVLSSVLLMTLALGGLNAQLGLTPPGGDVPLTEQPTRYGLGESELAIQPVVSPRPVALRLPPGSTPAGVRERRRHWRPPGPPREAYNRLVWYQPSSEPRAGPVAPLADVHGQ